MRSTSVTSRDQSRSERELRRRLGIRQRSRIESVLRVARASAPAARNGFGLLKSARKPVAADLDPASLFGGSRRRKTAP